MEAHSRRVWARYSAYSWRRQYSRRCDNDIQHIAGEDNIVADAISRLPTATGGQSEQRTEAQGPSKMLTDAEHFVLEKDEAFPLTLSQVRREQNKSSIQIIQNFN